MTAHFDEDTKRAVIKAVVFDMRSLSDVCMEYNLYTKAGGKYYPYYSLVRKWIRQYQKYGYEYFARDHRTKE